MHKPWPPGVDLIAGPYTPASLLALAERKDAEYRELLELHPPGTINEERNNAHDLSRVAFACAAWMEAGGHKELSHVGPFHSFMPNRAQKVLVRKGSVIFSTSPKMSCDGTVAGRDQVVTVHSMDQGFVVDEGRRGKPDVRQGCVHWAGAGGYWRWTELTNIELVEQANAALPA